METVKTTPKVEAKETPKEVAKAPKKQAKKYLVIKNFTADKAYYVGNDFISDNAQLVEQLLTAKLIR